MFQIPNPLLYLCCKLLQTWPWALLPCGLYKPLFPIALKNWLWISIISLFPDKAVFVREFPQETFCPCILWQKHSVHSDKLTIVSSRNGTLRSNPSRCAAWQRRSNSSGRRSIRLWRMRTAVELRGGRESETLARGIGLIFPLPKIEIVHKTTEKH